MIEIPEAVRICEACGDVAAGEACATCERLADRYDARYHAFRAAQLFHSLPRETPQVIAGDGLDAMRGLGWALKFTALAAAVMFIFGFLLRRFS